MRLIDAAKVLRSKNAGPLTVSVDLMFADEEAFEYARHSDALTPENVARLYGTSVDAVRVFAYPPAWAIKIVMARTVVAGGPGDTDVYGAQQHGPLLELEL